MSETDFIIGIIVFMIVAAISAVVYILIEYGPAEEYEDDGKPIENEHLMVIHCDVVHTGTGLYQTLDCLVCPYRDEECKKYRHRHNGKTPVEVLRGNNQEEGKK